MTDVEAANSICAILRRKAEDGKTMMLGALRKFFEEEHGSVAGLEEGLKYAVEQKWLTHNDHRVWLVK